VKTESALQLSITSKAKPSTVVSRCRYQKSVKTPKVVATIEKKSLSRPISIAAPSPAKALISTKHLAKKFKGKGVLIPVEKQRRTHEKRPEKKKQSKEHVNTVHDQGLFDFSSKEGLMFTHISGRDEVLVIDCVSEDFDQPIAQSPNVLDTRWHGIATNLLRFAKSCDSDSTEADYHLALQEITYGIQISPLEYTTQEEDAAASDVSTSPGSLPDLVSVDDEASMNETSDASEVSVNEASGSLAYVLSSDDEVSVNEASVVSGVSVNETSVISEVSVNETSGSLTTVVSGDAETANGHLPLFFIVYVANSKGASKGSAIPERAPLMKTVPLGAQRNFVTQTDKEKRATFALISLYHYRNIPESLRQTIPAYWLLLDSGATVSVSQDDSLMINIVMSSDLVLGLSEHCRATAKGELFAMTFIMRDGKWIRKHFRSGRRNCLLVPDSSRPIMSSIQLDKQGHQPHAFGSNPGLVLFGDEGFIPFVREEETGFYLMPCMPPSFRDPDVYSEEILNLNYAVDDGRFKYSSKLEEQISVQALPARGLNSKLRKGLKLSIAFKKPHLKITKRKKHRVATELSIDSEVTTTASANLLRQRL